MTPRGHALHPFVRPPSDFPGQAAASPHRWFAELSWPALQAFAISLAVLVPCFWHPHLPAGDLGSHVYNAWLAELIRTGQASGLWIAPQAGNVLFDWLLDALARLGGLAIAERLAVSCAVLVFFWGAVLWAWSWTRVRTWIVAPPLAMVSYGWTFHAGFFNYYLAIGLSFWALALWNVDGGRRWLAVALLPLVYCAHPLGAGWLAGALAYVEVARRLQPRWRLGLLFTALGLLAGLGAYLTGHFPVVREIYPAWRINGADQLVLGSAYHLVALGFAALSALVWASCLGARRRRAGPGSGPGLPLQLYIVTLGAVWLLPTSVQLPGYAGPLAYVLERLSLISAVLVCCLVAGSSPRRWHGLGFAALAVAYFALLFRDTAELDRIASRLDSLVHGAPPRSRVIMARLRCPGSRLLFNHHLLDRACAGRALAYANYEPATGQFRVRARPGNGIVLATMAEVDAVQDGSFVARPPDLPLYEVVRRGSDPADLALRPLGPGERMRGLAPPAP